MQPFWSVDHDHFYSEMKPTFDGLSHAKGAISYRKGEKEAGLEKMEQAIQVLSILIARTVSIHYKLEHAGTHHEVSEREWDKW